MKPSFASGSRTEVEQFIKNKVNDVLREPVNRKAETEVVDKKITAVNLIGP